MINISIRNYSGEEILQTNSEEFLVDLDTNRDKLTQWWGISVEYSGGPAWTEWDGEYRTNRKYIDIGGRKIWKEFRLSSDDGKVDFFPRVLSALKEDIYG